MSDKIVELDQIDERNFDLGQEAEQQFDLGNPEVVVISGVRVQENPVDKGVAIYDQQDDELKTIVPDQEVTQNSENLVTSGAVYNYVEHHAGNVADVQVDDNSVVDNNKLAKLSTINGNYNASTNKLATESDLPTQASDVHALPDSTKYGASLDLANGSTLQLKDQDGNDLGSPVTISTEDTGATSVEVTGSGNAVTDASYSSENRKITLTKGTEFQTATDNSLNTDAKNVVSAINEVNTVAKNANIAKGFTSYSTLITDLNSATATAYKVGQSFYVQTLDVPDLWVISVETSSVAYTYTTDSAFETATAVAGGQQVGYYKLGQLETQKTDLSNYVAKTTTIAGVDLQDNITQSEMQTALDVVTKSDAQTITGAKTFSSEIIANNGIRTNNLNGLSGSTNIQVGKNLLPGVNNYVDLGATNRQWKDLYLAGNLSDGTNSVSVADAINKIESISAGGTALTPNVNKNVNIPYAGTNAGVVKISNSLGMGMTSAGIAYPLSASTSQIDEKTQVYNSITPSNLNYAVKSALTANNHLTMTSAEQATAQSVLGIDTLIGDIQTLLEGI